METLNSLWKHFPFDKAALTTALGLVRPVLTVDDPVTVETGINTQTITTELVRITGYGKTHMYMYIYNLLLLLLLKARLHCPTVELS